MTAHGPQCAVYARVVCITCGHHDHAHDRTTTECKWAGCRCGKFIAINPDAKFINLSLELLRDIDKSALVRVRPQLHARLKELLK
jgi:hypothetical protein